MVGKAFKTVFIRRGGRIIPIRKSTKGYPDELQKIEHKKRAMQSLKKEPTFKSTGSKQMQAAFYLSAKTDSKITGEKIAKRISKIKGRKK